MIVTNTAVARLYLAQLRESARRAAAFGECILPDGEQHKTLQTAGWVFDALVGQKLNRDADRAGAGRRRGRATSRASSPPATSAASRYVQIPTTLLAQVDSSVGGKTGVNHSGGKNLIGAFYQPLAVIADTDTLATLPDRELKAGLAEVIKYGCVWDPLLFDWLDANIGKLLARDSEALTYAIARSCEIKATVVAHDEREQGLRAILNFGHTFGHAIEAATAYETYLHGEAVAIGMLMAADFSCRIGPDRRRGRAAAARPAGARGAADRGAENRRGTRSRPDAHGQEGARGRGASGGAGKARARHRASANTAGARSTPR